MACGNRPPRVAFPDLPSVPDVVNPDAWLTRVNRQQVVRRVTRQGCVKVDVSPYSISSKLAGQGVTFSLHAQEQSLEVVSQEEYRRSLPRKRPATAGSVFSGVCGTYAARSFDANRVCML